MNPNDYVSYPLALALKKAGFDWECDHYYTNGYVNDNPEDISRVVKLHSGRLYNHNMVISSDGECVSAPSLWQTQKWLREVKKWHIIVEPRIWEQQVYDFKLWHYYRGYENANRGFDYLSYESALSAGIAAALELIEKK